MLNTDCNLFVQSIELQSTLVAVFIHLAVTSDAVAVTTIANDFVIPGLRMQLI